MYSHNQCALLTTANKCGIEIQSFAEHSAPTLCSLQVKLVVLEKLFSLFFFFTCRHQQLYLTALQKSRKLHRQHKWIQMPLCDWICWTDLWTERCLHNMNWRMHSRHQPFEIPLPGVQIWETRHSEKMPFIRKKETFFVHYNLSLFTSTYFTDHETQIQTFMGHWKVSQSRLKEKRARTKSTTQQVRGVCSSLRCISWSFSPCHCQTSKLPQQGRLFSSQKIDFQTTLSSESQLESGAGKCSLPAQQSETKTRTAYNSTTWRADGEKRNFTGPKRQLFLQNEGVFEGSTSSLVSQLHPGKKWRRCGNHNYQKLKFECTQVTIVRNRTMESQRVKII